MTRIDIIRFLEDNKIKYEEDRENINCGRIRLPEYKRVLAINYYYENCSIEVKGDSDIEVYDANKLSMRFLELNGR